MNVNLNRVYLMGRIGKTIAIRETHSGTPVCDFILAVNEKWNKEDGEQGSKATFVPIVVFGRQAEVCAETLRVGDSVHIEGKLRVTKHKPKNAEREYEKMEVHANFVTFLELKPESNQPSEKSE